MQEPGRRLPARDFLARRTLPETGEVTPPVDRRAEIVSGLAAMQDEIRAGSRGLDVATVRQISDWRRELETIDARNDSEAAA